jgi:hypothetical protein
MHMRCASSNYCHCCAGSFLTFTHGAVSQHFVLPSYGIAIRMVDCQLVVFDHQVPHCASRPSLGKDAHTYGVVPVVKKECGASTPQNRHVSNQAPSLAPMPVSNEVHVGRRQMAQCYSKPK